VPTGGTLEEGGDADIQRDSRWQHHPAHRVKAVVPHSARLLLSSIVVAVVFGCGYEQRRPSRDPACRGVWWSDFGCWRRAHVTILPLRSGSWRWVGWNARFAPRLSPA